MAIELQGFKFTAIAGESLAASQYHFVKLSANMTVITCAAAADIPCGVLQNNPPINGAAEVMVFGITKIIGANLAAGNLIGTHTDGTAVVIDPDGVGDLYYVGQVVIGTGAGATEVASALVNCATPVIQSGS